MTQKLALVALASLCACVNKPSPRPADRFFERLSSLCGHQLEGRTASRDPADAAFVSQPLVARFGPCTPGEVRIAFDVGPDRSRTWIVTRTPDGLRLKHRHLLQDGSVDPVSDYGGDSILPGHPMRQEFPADAFSRALFTREGRAASAANIWAMELSPTGAFTYELSRPGRLFRVSFSAPAKRDKRSGR